MTGPLVTFDCFTPTNLAIKSNWSWRVIYDVITLRDNKWCIELFSPICPLILPLPQALYWQSGLIDSYCSIFLLTKNHQLYSQTSQLTPEEPCWQKHWLTVGVWGLHCWKQSQVPYQGDRSSLFQSRIPAVFKMLCSGLRVRSKKTAEKWNKSDHHREVQPSVEPSCCVWPCTTTRLLTSHHSVQLSLCNSAAFRPTVTYICCHYLLSG